MAAINLINLMMIKLAIILCITYSVQCRSLIVDKSTTSMPNTTETTATTSPRITSTTFKSNDLNELRPVFMASDVNLFSSNRGKHSVESGVGEKMSESGYNYTYTPPKKDNDNSTKLSTSSTTTTASNIASLTMTPRSASIESAQSSISARTFIDILRDYEKNKLKMASNNYNSANKMSSLSIPAVNYEDRLRGQSLSENEAFSDAQALQGFSQNLLSPSGSLTFNHLDDVDEIINPWADDEHTSFGVSGLKPFSGHILDTAEAGSSIYDLRHLDAHHHLHHPRHHHHHHPHHHSHNDLNLFSHNFFMPEIIDSHHHSENSDAKNPTASQSTAYESNYHPMSGNDVENRGKQNYDKKEQENVHHHHSHLSHDSNRNRHHESNSNHNPSLEASHGESSSTENPDTLLGHEDAGMDEPSFINYAQLMSQHMHSDELPILIESYVVNYPPLNKHQQTASSSSLPLQMAEAHSLSAFSYEQQFPLINEGYRHSPERVLISPLLYSRPCKFDCFAPPLQDMKYGLMNFLEGAHNHG